MAVGAVVGGGGLAAPGGPASATVRPAYPFSAVSFIGHGWGHGIGMGQWGALGYALGQDDGLGNWTYQQIVDHYYDGTSLATLSSSADATDVRIAMTEDDGANLIATAPGGLTVPGAGGTATATMFVPDDPAAGTWAVYTGPGCAGPWTEVADGVGSPSTGASGGGDLTLCTTAGNVTVPGTLTGVYNADAQARTVNTLPLEQYVADTVPGESPSGWGDLGGAGPQGQDWGFQELEAQAVAVRSYVMSDLGGYGASSGVPGYADTCDLSCQTYRGTTYETALSDLAAADTAGQVMENPDGSVAVTEYSASTGGYTTGAQFTAVPDAGDAICIPGACNPNHSWRTSVPVTTVEADWPQVGTLEAVEVTARNGLGDLGGRVEELTLVGSAGSLPLTGSDFATTLGLNSDWFAVVSAPSGGVGGYRLAAADGGIFAFGDASYDGSMGGQPLNEPVVGIAGTADHQGYWEVATDGGIFSFGDATFDGSMGGRPLNRPVVGMAATPDGGGYWEVASDGGIFSFGDARFHGSTGSMTLNRPVVGMAATPDGGGYWLVASDGGIFAFGDARFYGSTGAMTLDAPIVGMAATPDGGGYWLVASDGGVFTFGDATFEGSAAGTAGGTDTVALLATADGGGYLTVTAGGQVTDFGDAPQLGDLTTAVPGYGGQVVGGVTTP